MGRPKVLSVPKGSILDHPNFGDQYTREESSFAVANKTISEAQLFVVSPCLIHRSSKAFQAIALESVFGAVRWAESLAAMPGEYAIKKDPSLL
jgi:hypothetical protein